jgi:uncharacterized protein
MTQHTHHAIDYIELSVADLPAAKRFYTDAFEWRFNDYGDEYAGIRAPEGDAEVGGLGVGGHLPPGPGGVLVLLYSGDLDASLAAVRKAGGTVAVEPYDFPGGRRALFSDLDGNTLGVWTAVDGPAE